MASTLTDRLSRLVKTMRGQARITESNVADMLREVRMALLEADVALPVVRDFVARVKAKALGQEVVGSLNPGQALVGIVHKELAATMGEGVADLNLATQPPAVILMAGLQGAGKTTTTAKLARHLILKRKKKVLTVSADVYRPAAIEQLRTVSAQAGADWFASDAQQKPREIAIGLQQRRPLPAQQPRLHLAHEAGEQWRQEKHQQHLRALKGEIVDHGHIASTNKRSTRAANTSDR